MKLIKKYLNKINPNSNFYYSQNGEDVIINNIFQNLEVGFYIDVGAYHPKRFSNTYKLYQRGWSGINIDALPGSMLLFNKFRRRDVNLEVPIFDNRTKLTFYQFKENAYNTLDKNNVEKLKQNMIIPINEYELETKTLEDILDEYVMDRFEIELLDIDVEGIDFNVLKSINIKKYKPKVILIEIWSTSLNELLNNEISRFLDQNNYLIYSKIHDSVIFIRKDFYSERFL